MTAILELSGAVTVPTTTPRAKTLTADPAALAAVVADLHGGALEWQDSALCAETDPEAFFPEKGSSTRQAKGICTLCPVEEACLEYALANGIRFGVWGGKSEKERRKLRPNVMVNNGRPKGS